jgi:secretion/DNA translocation related CpaE-like protein
MGTDRRAGAVERTDMLRRNGRQAEGARDPVRPLIVTSDPRLIEEILPLAAAGCGEVDVAHDAIAARRYWRAAQLVVVGADAAAGCVRARLPHRRDIILVADGAEPDEESEDESWQVAGALGADHVVVLPAAATWLTERFSTAGSRRAEEAPVVAVIGGRGGAGASVLAAGLAVTSARSGQRTMLVDGDPLGGGVDLLLGWETATGLRWPELAEARGRVNVTALYADLLRSELNGELVVVSWDRGDALDLPTEAMDATLDAGRRGSDLVVVDLPRHLDDAATRAAQLSDVVLIVVPADVRGCAAACRVAAQIGPHCRSLQLVVRGPAPGGLRSEDVGRAIGLPVAGTLRPEPDLPAALEEAESPAATGKGPLAELCAELLDTVVGPAAVREVA